MAHTPANSPVNSLKGKIRLASLALGFFILVFGAVACLAQTLLGATTFFAVFVPFLLLAVLAPVFLWRIADDSAAPIERVSLLAKSFERGLTATLPKTTGAAETDELLQTIHRLGRQTKRIVEAMDLAADGDTDAALKIELGSDKSSQAFQKLLARVAESIRAKQELERLKTAIARFGAEVSIVRQGDLRVAALAKTGALEESAATINFLIARLAEATALIRAHGEQAQNRAAGTFQMLAETARDDERRIRELNRAAIELKQVPQAARKISEDLARSSEQAAQAAEKAGRGTRTAQENLESIGALRRKIQDTVRRTHQLRERSREISLVAKTIEDLARRAALVALNASIQSSETGEAGRGFAVVSGEIERLAARAEETGKAVASLNKAVASEIGAVETALESTFGEAANLSKFAIETGDALGELEKYAARFLSLQKELATYANAQSEETERAFAVFTGAIGETADRLPRFKEAAQNLAAAADLLEELRASADDYKIAAPEPAAEAPAATADFVEFQLTGD